MRFLRNVCMLIGFALLLLLLRCLRIDATREAVALAPATLGGVLLMLLNVQDAYTRARRRLIASCWVLAAILTGVSVVVAMGTGVTQLASVMLALSIFQGIAAVYAWRRSKVYRLKFYNKYLEE